MISSGVIHGMLLKLMNIVIIISTSTRPPFPHGTCSLSVSCCYLALDGVYHPLWAAFPNNPTLPGAYDYCRSMLVLYWWIHVSPTEISQNSYQILSPSFCTCVRVCISAHQHSSIMISLSFPPLPFPPPHSFSVCLTLTGTG